MAIICEGCFPNKPEGFYMDGYLRDNLDILAKKIAHDFDFVILISGSGMTRVGKSLMGMQVGYYLTQRVNEINKLNNTFSTDNYTFRGEELIKVAKSMPPYSVIAYDEAGSDLMARKTMHSTTQALLDFFREAGQLNLFLICILPDFFDLPKGIALTRSVCLIDVQFADKFERGNFNFYGRKAKKFLYLKGRKYLDYDSHRPDFRGGFTNFYTIDESKYRQMKMDALQGREKQAELRLNSVHKRLTAHRRKLIDMLHIKGVSQTSIAEELGLSQCEVSKIIKGDLN
jgi:hypothetical protein